MDSILCSDNEMEKLASITTHPSLCQWLQNSQWHGQGQVLLSLLEWVMAAIHTVWADARDSAKHCSKWQSFADLVQILWELGMGQPMLNPNTQGPDDE